MLPGLRARLLDIIFAFAPRSANGTPYRDNTSGIYSRNASAAARLRDPVPIVRPSHFLLLSLGEDRGATTG